MIRTDSETIAIFKGKPMEAEMVNQLLNDHGIITFISNRLMGSIAPWQVSSGGFNPVEVIINKRDQEKARELIEEFHSKT